MARGINKVILIGNLGNDPEVRYMPEGGAVTTISLATSESWKDKQTGEAQERTEWHRVVFYRRLAEIAGEYLHKGSRCYIEGSLKTRKWQDKTTGQDRYMTEIIAAEMQILDSKKSSSGDYEATTPAARPTNNTATATAPAHHEEASAAPNFDDDIPF